MDYHTLSTNLSIQDQFQDSEYVIKIFIQLNLRVPLPIEISTPITGVNLQVDLPTLVRIPKNIVIQRKLSPLNQIPTLKIIQRLILLSETLEKISLDKLVLILQRLIQYQFLNQNCQRSLTFPSLNNLRQFSASYTYVLLPE